MFVTKQYRELIKELQEQIKILRGENTILLKEIRSWRSELMSAAEKPAELVDRILSISEECDSLRDINRELKYKLADYKNAEKVAQGSQKEE